MWHRDNVKPGLTVIVALRDVASNGPTEIILRSHCGDAYSKLEADALCIEERILLASIKMGDAILYDSRCLHRGRGYGRNKRDKDEDGVVRQFDDRPVLVLRWDAKQTPAPGTGLIGTTLNMREGEARAFAYTVLSWVGR
jgi:hypothetical protein